MKCLGLILWMAVLLVAQPAPDRKPAPRGKHADDSFLSGSPFTFEQMLRLAGEDAIPLRRRKEAIQDRGVDFEFTPDRMEKLKAAGAPAEVLDDVESAPTAYHNRLTVAKAFAQSPVSATMVSISTTMR